jgi:hypothetical protein
MMRFAQQVLMFVAITAFVFLVIGLFKPWMMLWWEDIQNRRKVIQLYGTVALVSLITYWSLRLILK